LHTRSERSNAQLHRRTTNVDRRLGHPPYPAAVPPRRHRERRRPTNAAKAPRYPARPGLRSA